MKIAHALLIFFLSTFMTHCQKAVDESKWIKQEITYTDGEIQMKGFLAYHGKNKGKVPGVIVVHEWWGHNDYARSRAEMLAKEGYVAMSIDMYGDGQTAEHPDDAKKFMMATFSNIQSAENRFQAAMNELKKVSNGKIAAIGYCFGGGVVLHMARKGMPLNAVASFHGSLNTQSPAKKGVVQAKVLVYNGGADSMVPSASIEGFEKEMREANVDYKLITYKSAKHAFTNPGATEKGEKFNMPLVYDQEADKASWADMLREFKDSL